MAFSEWTRIERRKALFYTVRNESKNREKVTEMHNNQLDELRQEYAKKVEKKMQEHMKRTMQSIHGLKKEMEHFENQKLVHKKSGLKWEKVITGNPMRLFNARSAADYAASGWATPSAWTTDVDSDLDTCSRSLRSSRHRGKSGKRKPRSRTASLHRSRSRQTAKPSFFPPRPKTRQLLSARPYRPKRSVVDAKSGRFSSRPRTCHSFQTQPSSSRTTGASSYGDSTVRSLSRSYFELGHSIRRRRLSSLELESDAYSEYGNSTCDRVQSKRMRQIQSTPDWAATITKSSGSEKRRRVLRQLKAQTEDVGERVYSFCDRIREFASACQVEREGVKESRRNSVLDSALSIGMVIV